LAAVEYLAHDSAVMQAGRAVAAGPAEEILAAPTHTAGRGRIEVDARRRSSVATLRLLGPALLLQSDIRRSRVSETQQTSQRDRGCC
jgi:ABC-type glutathione transport system ATPase component